MATSTRLQTQRFALAIGGVNVAGLTAFDGLDLRADVVENDLGPDATPKKHVANIAWTRGHATTGFAMGAGLYQWVKASLEAGFSQRDGEFALADFNDKVQSKRAFFGATIVEFTVPRLDGAVKSAGRFELVFDTEGVRWSAGTGEDIRGRLSTRQKAWLASNFRVEIGSLPCARIASIDAFTWRCAIDSAAGRPGGPPARVKIGVPDLMVTVALADEAAWAEAAKKWFIDGQHLEADEMTGRIVFLAPDMKEELGAIELAGVGFKGFSFAPTAAANGTIQRFAARFYVEKMALRIAAYEP